MTRMLTRGYAGRIGALALARSPLGYKRILMAKRAATIGRLAWQNRRVIKSGLKYAARKIQRFWRGKRGAPNKIPSAETVLSEDNPQCYPKTIYEAYVTFSNETAETTKNRTGNHVHFSGVKACFDFVNETQEVIKIHLALIQQKSKNDSNIDIEFFRDPENTVSRTKDFDNWHVSGEAQKYNCWSINPDRYNILWRKSRIVYPYEDSNAYQRNTDKNYFWHFQKYTKIKKIVNFETPTATQITQPYKFVWWAEPVDVTKITDFTPTFFYRVNHMLLTYFRNVS